MKILTLFLLLTLVFAYTSTAYADNTEDLNSHEQTEKIPPLPEIVTPDFSRKYLNVDSGFVAKTKYARDYVAWVNQQTDISLRHVNFAGVSATVLYVNHSVVKIETADPMVIAYYEHNSPVVLYAYLLGKDNMYTVQYYDGWKLLYLQLVNGPGELKNAWCEYTTKESKKSKRGKTGSD